MGRRRRCELRDEYGSATLESRLYDPKLTISASSGIVEHVPSTVLETIGGRIAVERSARLAELNHARLEVVERPFDQALLLLVVSQEVVPQSVLAENLGVAEKDQTVLGPGEGDVEAARVVEESDALMLVAPHTGDDDVILLPSLERVDAGHFDLLVELLLERAVELHVRDDVGALALVWSDDTDLTGEDAGLEEPRDDLLDVGSLGSEKSDER